MERFFNKIDAFGLDISDLSLKISYFKEKKGEIVPFVFSQKKIAKGIIDKGVVKDKKMLAKEIKVALDKIRKKIKTNYAICSLPEEKSFLFILKVPVMEEKELKEAVGFEIENYIPLQKEKVYYDFEILTKEQESFEVLVSASEKEVVDSYLAGLKEAEIQPVIFENECLAIARALVPLEKKENSFLIIDLGETRTTLLFFAEGAVRLTSTIPISGKGLTEILAKNFKISFEEAERLKLKEGLEGKREVFDSLIPVLTDLSEQIAKYLDYAISRKLDHKISPIKKIILCGGGANLKGIESYLAKKIKIPVEAGNPWVNIYPKEFKTIPPLSFEQSLSFTTAIGLALRIFYDKSFTKI